MSALPKSMPADEVAREQADGHSGADEHVVRLDLAGKSAPDFRTPFFALVERLRNSDRCEICGKTRVLLRIGAMHHRDSEERPDPSFHCACPGVPAHVPAALQPGAAVIARHQLIYFQARTQLMRYIAGGTRGFIQKIENRVAFLEFEGHEQPYLQTATRLTTIVDVVDATEGGSR
jgi:hypothetical protein